MRRLCLVALLVLAGCQNTKGPLAPRRPDRVDDPLLSIEEQKRRAHDRFSLPDDTATVAPKTGIERYGPSGR